MSIIKRASALFIILLFVLLSVGNVFADFADGDGDVDTTTGNVGIGTTLTSHILTLSIDPTDSNQPVGVRNEDLTDPHTALYISGKGNVVDEKIGIQFGHSESAPNFWGIGGIYAVMDSSVGDTTGDITFDFREGTTDATLTEVMRITHEGKVGIGITSPGAKLEIDTDPGDNVIGLIVDQDDTDNNPTALEIQNDGTGDSLVIDTNEFVVKGDGNVGIGTATPATELDVAGGINASTLNISGNAYLATQSGNVGIGITAPTRKLHVDGSVNATGNLTVDGFFKSLGSFTGSSISMKKDIETLSWPEQNNILEQIKKLELVKFRYNNQGDTTTKTLGVIAENSPKEILSTDGYSVNLMSYASYSIAAIQKQQKMIESLEGHNKDLKNELLKLKSQNADILIRLKALENAK